MKFSFFESLTKEEAQEYLNEFLLFGKSRGIEILEGNLHFTIDVDFSIESLSPIFKRLLRELKTIPKEPDLSLPEFIRNTNSYKQNLFDFDEPSKTVILASAYYLGEAFVKRFDTLAWATGNTKNAEGNMPVIRTFKYGIEMAPILIAENMFKSVISRMSDDRSIDTAIEAWINNVPND